MAIEFKDGKYVDPKTGHVTLDPTIYKDWQIAEEAEKNLPSVAVPSSSSNPRRSSATLSVCFLEADSASAHIRDPSCFRRYPAT